MSHALYSPSKLPRIISCPGSVNLTRDMEDTTNKYAEEGTMLHGIMELLLKRNEFIVPDSIIAEYSLVDEQIEALTDCLDYVFALLNKQEDESYTLVEANVTLEGFSYLLKCDELCDVSGTLDLLISVPSNRKMYVIDWKFGKGEVWPDSAQLKAYALAALRNETVMKNFDSVHIIIGQPRLYMGDIFKELTTTPDELLSWAKEELVPALEQVNNVPGVFNPSEKACQWCLGKTSCKARHTKNLETAQEVFKVYADLPDKVDIQEVVDLLAKSKDLVKYIKDLENFVRNKLMNGHNVPGLKVVEGRSIRKWVNEDEIKQVLLDKYDLEWENIHTNKFKSPNQIEKILKSKKAKEIKEFIVKPKGAPTVVPESDKRKAIKFKTAEEAFADFITNQT